MGACCSCNKPPPNWEEPLVSQSDNALLGPNDRHYITEPKTSSEPTVYYIFGPPEGIPLASLYSGVSATQATTFLSDKRAMQSFAIRRGLSGPESGGIEIAGGLEHTYFSAVEYFMKREYLDARLYAGADADGQLIATLHTREAGEPFGTVQVATPTPNWPDQQPSHGRNKSSDYFFAQTRNDYWMPYTADNQSELSALTINEFTDSLRKDTKEKKAEQIKRLCRHELVTGGGWQDCWRYKATVVDGTKKENMNQVVAKAEGFGRSDGVTDEEACGPGYHQCASKHIKVSISPGFDHGAILTMIIKEWILTDLDYQD